MSEKKTPPEKTPVESRPETSGRRDFLKLGTAATVGFLARGLVPEAAQALPPLPSNPVTPEAMPPRNLGRTGYRSGIFSLGGQAAIEQPNNDAVAVPIVERALDLGINYLDTAAMYGGEARWSQRYIGQVMKHRRRETCLASNTHDPTPDRSLTPPPPPPGGATPFRAGGGWSSSSPRGAQGNPPGGPASRSSSAFS